MIAGLVLCTVVISVIVVINRPHKAADDNNKVVSVSKMDRALKAYRKYADSLECEASYYLVDMDDDSVPECIVSLYALNGDYNYTAVLGYKNKKLMEVDNSGGGGTISNFNGVQDGTVFWYPDTDYFVIFTDNQTWWGDLLKSERCSWRIFNISNFEDDHFILVERDNLDTDWHYGVDGEGSSTSRQEAEAIFSELSDSSVYSKSPTRYVTLEDAIEEYLSK